MNCAKEIFEFGPFRLDVKERRLLRNGEPVQLRAKVFDTLRVLVENHGKLVGKDEMMKALWPNAIVEEGNLAHNLTVLRKALGDKDTGEQHVQTIAGQGYRFIANVKVLPDPREDTLVPTINHGRSAWNRPSRRWQSSLTVSPLKIGSAVMW